MKKKITIECGFEEACLIERALELYSRVGILQFDYLTLCGSLQKLIWDKNLSTEFRNKADDLKSVFGYTANSNPGIYNTDIVSDDARIAAHLYQQFRHERYKERIKSGEQTERSYTVDEHPADICQVGGMKTPDCKIEITSDDKLSFIDLVQSRIDVLEKDLKVTKRVMDTVTHEKIQLTIDVLKDLLSETSDDKQSF